MRMLGYAIAIALVLAVQKAAEAQVVFPDPGTTVVYSSGYSVPYSYYAAWPNWPARQYVGYGENDIFPFYGHPYGRVYDRWTWAAMSDVAYGGVLNRYYYPPVR